MRRNKDIYQNIKRLGASLAGYAALLTLPLLSLTSCSSMEDNFQSTVKESLPLKIYTEIAGKNIATRAERTNIDDHWSYVQFQEGDEMGFFASGGNFQDNNGPFDNEKLTYDGSKFNGDSEATFSPTYMNGDEIFMYYPYSPDITTYPGVTLRENVPDNPEEPQRCMDLLTSSELNITGVDNGKDLALFGNIYHAFSELIIVRGEGFDNPPTTDPKYSVITAVLREPVTNALITVSNDPSWSCSLTLEYDGSIDETAARSWQAWKGENFRATAQDEVGEEAWYVVLPTVGSVEKNKRPGLRTTVDYIELYDNEGHLQRVSSLRLSQGNTKYLDGGWKYPMKITMNELVPTVNPYPIIPWGEDVNLTDERKRGINNITEFAEWVRDYNLYLLAPGDETNIGNMMKYGDKYVDADNNISWHFYVLTDLDFQNYAPLPYNDLEGNVVTPSNTVIIPKLVDILDGLSTTLVGSKFMNHKILNLDKTFIGEMGTNVSLQNNGTLRNFDFVSPDVNNGLTSESPAGIITNTMDGATVDNCNISNGNLFNPNGPAGMITGTINNGVIRDCTVGGFLYSSTRYDDNVAYAKLSGEVPEGDCTFEDNNTADVNQIN